MIRRTYSGYCASAARDEEPASKRRRVSAPTEYQNSPLSSCGGTDEQHSSQAEPRTSTSSSVLPSSDLPSESLPEAITPPTSPASAPSLPSSPPFQAASKQKPLFPLFLRKRQPSPRSRSEPLHEVSVNARDRRQRPKKPPKMRQLMIDLGGPLTHRCDGCGMEYTPSSTEDASLHKKFHAQNAGGVELKKAFVDTVRAENCVWRGDRDEVVFEIRSKDSLAKRRAAERVLDLVERDLGAVPIAREVLWGGTGAVAGPEQQQLAKSDRYKVYMYVRGSRCVGFCLAQRIRSARLVIDQTECTPDDVSKMGHERAQHSSSSISTSSECRKAVLGISRIWTSSTARRQGVAATLLETARRNFLFGIAVPKDHMAFSQPTESGGKLARKWFGKENGWLVYTE